MPTIVIRHKVEPIKGGPHYAVLSGAFATIFVSHADQKAAELAAFDFLFSQGWVSVELLGINGPILRKHVEYDPTLLALYDKAQLSGISGDFVGFKGGAPVMN